MALNFSEIPGKTILLDGNDSTNPFADYAVGITLVGSVSMSMSVQTGDSYTLAGEARSNGPGGAIYNGPAHATVVSGNIDAIFRELTYTTPILANGQSATVLARTSVMDVEGDPMITNTQTIVIDTPPAIVGIIASQTTNGLNVSPFPTTYIKDENPGAKLDATITITNSAGQVTDSDGLLSGAGLFKIGVGNYEIDQQSSQSTLNLSQISFTPGNVYIGENETAHFNLSVTDVGAGLKGLTTVSGTSVTIIGPTPTPTPNPSPGSGGSASLTGNLDILPSISSDKPFINFNITDAYDSAGYESVFVQLSPEYYSANGFGSLTGGAKSAPGGYFYDVFQTNTLGGPSYTAEWNRGSGLTIDQVLQALVYTTPTLNPGQGSSVKASVYVNTALQGNPIDLETVTSPLITKTVPNQPIDSGISLTPFANVVVQDLNFGGYNTNLQYQITVTDASGGGPTDADGTFTGNGLSKTGVGTYTIPIQYIYLLDELKFTAAQIDAGDQKTVNIELDTVDTKAGTSAKDTTTSVLILGEGSKTIQPTPTPTPAATPAPTPSPTPTPAPTPPPTQTLPPTPVPIPDTAPSPPPNQTAAPTPSVTPTPTVTATYNFMVVDNSTGANGNTNADPYSGPVAGIQYQYIDLTPDNLTIKATVPNTFMHSGSGTDAIAALSGTNVLDGGTGSNFLTGGSGTDTFFVDDRAASSDIWSTMVNFHSGDAATVYGVTPSSFAINWVDGQGATGYQGLTLHATEAGVPTASLTLVGYTSADLTNGRLTVSFGTDTASNSSYMYVKGN